MNFPIYLTQGFADSIVSYLKITAFFPNIMEYNILL